MNKIGNVSLSLIILCFFTTSAIGQIDSFRNKFIETLSRDIHKYYVSAKLANEMTDYVKSKYKAGGYDSTLNSDEFAFEITQDLRSISKDNHITITPLHYDYFEDSLSAAKKINDLTPNQKKKQFAKSQVAVKQLGEERKKRTHDDMFTYGDIKILPGNVGYVEILDFGSTTVNRMNNKNRIDIASVFKYLQNTSAVIIDLRENAGGLTRMAAKFCSYFSPQPNTYFITTEDFIRYDSSGIEKEFSLTRKHYTDNVITGSLMNKKAVYLLVSKRTFSAAELVAYKIKRFMPQALIIGEQTKGGGNGYSGMTTSKYYSATIPSEKMFDESYGDYNIEGIGITPDVATTADSAFAVTYQLANRNKPNIAEREFKYFYKSKVFKSTTKYENFEEYLGNYKKVTIYQDSDRLYMIYDTLKRFLLSPVQKDFFLSDTFESIRFVRNNNAVTSIEIKHTDGYIEKFRKL